MQLQLQPIRCHCIRLIFFLGKLLNGAETFVSLELKWNSELIVVGDFLIPIVLGLLKNTKTHSVLYGTVKETIQSVF